MEITAQPKETEPKQQKKMKQKTLKETCCFAQTSKGSETQGKTHCCGNFKSNEETKLLLCEQKEEGHFKHVKLGVF